MKKLKPFIDLLEDVIECAKEEEQMIAQGFESKWSLSQLRNTVLPEATELLSYARTGKVFYKFGKQQKMLISTYLLTESLNNLNTTALGQKISALQKLFNLL